MKKLHVIPGVCGLETTIVAEADEDGDITLTVESTCGAVRKMIDEIEMPLDAYEAVFVKPGEGPIYEAAKKLSHGACPVPCAVLKCIEAEAGLALSKDVSMKFI